VKAPARSTPRLVALAAMLLVPLAAIVAVLAWKPSPTPAPLPSASASTSTTAAAPVEDRTPEILGHILDADGNAVNGATVRLVSPSPPYTVYRDTKTDRAGAFSFPHVAPWRVRVVADHDPDGVVTSAALQSPDGGTTEITLVLSAAGAVRGTVVDADDHPVQGAVLTVEGVPWIVPAATSDDAGAFRIPTVPHEATSLVAVARGYRTARAVLGTRDDQVELVVRVRLLAAAPIDGVVLDPDGKPTSARVVACEEQPAEARAESAEDGTFQLPASAIGCDALAEQSESAPSDATPVVEGRRMTLRLKAGGAIEGAVVDDRGAAVPTFTVGVESFTPARGRTFDRAGPRSVEDPRGTFRLDHLAPGTYVLTASASGLPPARSEAIDVRGGAATRGVRIALLRGGIVTGHVFDEHHAPLAGADLHFDAVSSVANSSASALTDATGVFRMKLVSGLRVDSGATLQHDVTLVTLDGGAGLELGGVGATLEARGGGITLRDVFPGDPAGLAGLRAGDRILRIDGETTQGMSMADVLQRLRGEPGTSVGVSAQRPETGETVELTIVRGTIVR
jgi:hypothetical protein